MPPSKYDKAKQEKNEAFKDLLKALEAQDGELTDRILATADVRAALRLVELGEVDAGIVYATDAIASSRVTVVAEFPTTAHDPIEYHRVLLTNASPSGERFYRALGSDDAQDVYRRAGFSVGRE